jgi:hypothetical protein
MSSPTWRAAAGEPDGHAVGLGDHVLDGHAHIRQAARDALHRLLQAVASAGHGTPGVRHEVLGDQLVDRFGPAGHEDLVDEPPHERLVPVQLSHRLAPSAARAGASDYP